MVRHVVHLYVYSEYKHTLQYSIYIYAHICWCLMSRISARSSSTSASRLSQRRRTYNKDSMYICTCTCTCGSQIFHPACDSTWHTPTTEIWGVDSMTTSTYRTRNVCTYIHRSTSYVCTVHSFFTYVCTDGGTKATSVTYTRSRNTFILPLYFFFDRLPALVFKVS